MSNADQQAPDFMSRQLMWQLSAQPIAFELGGYHCEWLGWGLNRDHCWDSGPHHHSFYEVCYAFRGSGEYAIDGSVYPIRGGDLFAARPGQSHQISSSRTDPMGMYFWSFMLRATLPVDDGVGAMIAALADGRRSQAAGMDDFAGCVELAANECHRGQPGCVDVIRTQALRLLVLTARCLGASSVAPTSLKPALADFQAATLKTAERFMVDNAHRSITVQDVADHVFVSTRHLNRIFKAQLGQTPLQFLTATRLERAQRELLNGRQAIKVIASRCGYHDVQYFTSLFRRHVGMTPSAFRQTQGVWHERNRAGDVE